MEASDAAGGLIRRAAHRQMGKNERERAGALSTAQRHIHFLDSVRINATMDRSDFRFADLKRSKAIVFLVLPPERLDTYAR
ncbi:MAG: type IV secretory system conjugative DNA transfer family protein [Caulobacteraceae bacterium]